MVRLIKHPLFYPLLLALISMGIFFISYKPGTYLIGWDNTFPEFNFWENLKRHFEGGWLSYRGLGVYDGMANNANIVHTLLAGFLNLLLPQNMVRYVIITLLHSLGGIGAYYLFVYLTKKRFASFMGALFYMCNIGTIQQFYAPLETFAFQFAALPPLLLFTLIYVQRGAVASLRSFLITAIIFIPLAFVPTVFITTTIGIALTFFSPGEKKYHTKRRLTIVLIFFAVHSFWIIPYALGLPGNAKNIQHARINEYSSDEAYVSNKNRGDIVNVLMLKGFMLDVQEGNAKQGTAHAFMELWNAYLRSPWYIAGFCFLLIITIIGLIKGFHEKQYRFWYVIFGLCIVVLANNTPIISTINTIIRTSFPLINEALRFPFTKFISLYALTYSFFLVVGFGALQKYLYKQVQYIVYPLLLVSISIPLMFGGLYAPGLHLPVPAEYFSMFEYMKTLPKAERTALFPIHTFWSWQSRNWGYIGSDFLWFGIPQPILMRAFDPWSPYNEQFYNEANYTYETGNEEQFNEVLKKYNVRHIILDTTVVDGIVPKPINYDKYRDFLGKSTLLEDKKVFGALEVYSYTITSPSIKQAIPLSTNGIFTYHDPIIGNNNYSATPGINIYPYYSLMSTTNITKQSISIENNEHNTSLTSEQKIPKGAYLLHVPGYAQEGLIPVHIKIEGSTVTLEAIYPNVIIGGSSYTNLKPPVITYQFTQLSHITSVRIEGTTITLSNGEQTYIPNHAIVALEAQDGMGNTQVENNAIALRDDGFERDISLSTSSSIMVQLPRIFTSSYSIQSKNSQLLDVIYNNANVFSSVSRDEIKNQEYTQYVNTSMPHTNGYIAQITINHEQGLLPGMYIDSDATNRIEMETRLINTTNSQYIVVPPKNTAFQGYSFHLFSRSLGRTISKSIVKNFAVFPFPFTTLSSLSLTNTIQMPTTVFTNNESYSSWWQAYVVNTPLQRTIPFLFGKRLTGHTIVNNWQNGWEMSPSIEASHIVVVFLPQYAEYIGCIVLLVVVYYLYRKSRHKLTYTPLPKKHATIDV